jgi:hypothetical protein
MASIHQMVLQKLKKHSHKKSKPKSENKKPKPNKQRRSKPRSMGKKRNKSKSGGGGALRGIKGQLGGIINKVRPYALALGMGSVAVLALSKLKPDASMQTATFASAGAAYLAAGFEGMIGAEIIKAIAGAPSLLGSLNIGGGSGNAMQQNTAAWL